MLHLSSQIENRVWSRRLRNFFLKGSEKDGKDDGAPEKFFGTLRKDYGSWEINKEGGKRYGIRLDGRG